jgi:hypothetical protein
MAISRFSAALGDLAGNSSKEIVGLFFAFQISVNFIELFSFGTSGISYADFPLRTGIGYKFFLGLSISFERRANSPATQPASLWHHQLHGGQGRHPFSWGDVNKPSLRKSGRVSKLFDDLYEFMLYLIANFDHLEASI